MTAQELKRVSIGPEAIVAELMERWPQTIPVFLQRRMNCIGCMMSTFETLSDAARIYQVPLDSLLAELNRAANEPE